MITINLQFHGKIRLWFNEIGDFKISKGKSIIKEYLSTTHEIISNKTLIAEILLPRGGRNIYGLLGVDYKRNNSKSLKIIVNCDEKTIKPIFNNPLIQGIEPAFATLPNEYSQYVLNQIDSSYKNDQILLSGELNFCYAAYAEISSSGWIFNKLTIILLTALHLRREDINSDMIMSILA